MQLKCRRCNYEWDYKGKSEWYASCPRCRAAIYIRKLIIERLKVS